MSIPNVLAVAIMSSLVLVGNSYAVICAELIGGLSIETAPQFQKLIEMRWGTRWLGTKRLRQLARDLEFRLPETQDVLAIDKQDSLVIAHAALESGNKTAFRTIMEEVVVKGSSKGWEDQKDMSLKSYFGPALIRLFELQPTLIYQWRLLKRLGDWNVGNTVFGNFEIWQIRTTTPYGIWSFNVHPRSGMVSSSISHYAGVRYEETKSIVERVLSETQDQLDSSIPSSLYETRPHQGNENGGIAIQLASLKERTDRSENLLVFAVNMQNALVGVGSGSGSH